jgi:NTP pyrophosphatase (non-canonical NTP hydrolase)
MTMTEVEQLKARVTLLESRAGSLVNHLDREFLSDEAREAHLAMKEAVDDDNASKVRQQPITVRYTNWKSETRNRTIVPLAVWFGLSDFHEGEQWFIKALDAEKDSVRNFALLDISSTMDESFQARVQPWMHECFGHEISMDAVERNHRFLEEALELVQACGATRREALQMVDYVFNRDVGERQQEVGGVMVTLAALCLAHKISMHQCGEVELKRIWGKALEIREKQANKPKASPLPQFVPESQQSDDRQFMRDILDRLEFAANSSGIDSLESLIRWLPHMTMSDDSENETATEH